MPFVSYAQNSEDVLLWRALKDIQAGFYIDVGAWDPRNDSVTLAFYERAWRGINVEPDPKMFVKLETERPRDINLQVALGDTVGERSFYTFVDTGWSTLIPAIARRHQEAGAKFEQHRVSVMRLADICDLYAPQEIHFLKIDVEGAERAVLMSGDFSRHRPWIVIVEATEPNSPVDSHAAWESVLLEACYKLAYFDGLNRYYVSEEKAVSLLQCFTTPPNVFDDFVSIPSLRKSLETHEAGFALPELDNELAKIREEEAARYKDVFDSTSMQHQQDLAEAQVKLKAAELQAIEAELNARLIEAESRVPIEARLSRQPSNETTLHASDRGRLATPLRRILYDAGLIIHFGLGPPVGIVRVEQYVAEFLVRENSDCIQFVIFEPELCGYRELNPKERTLLNNILLNRYNASKFAEMPPDDASPVGDLQIIEPSPSVPPATVPDSESANDHEGGVPDNRRGLLGKFVTSSRISPEIFNEVISKDLRRMLPIRPNHSPARRAATRVLRRGLVLGARIGQRALYYLIAPMRAGLRAAKFMVRPDPVDLTQPAIAGAMEPAVVPQPPTVPAVVPQPPTVPAVLPQPPTVPSSLIQFEAGDTLISIANTWDYMDYSYLTRIVRHDGVRLISVIYDVIAMERPYTTPAAMHIYHRHWVEVGHLATHIVAISKYSEDSYRRFIAEPNHLNPSMSYAHLPNFLYHRREEIGETEVPEVQGHRFVVFCSTIETRKNHQLLLHLWDRLREEVEEALLPTLVFVGSWGWGTETVRLLSERNWRLRNHLRILDEISDSQLIWLYRHASFTLFPALSEGFGLGVAESLSFGTPVVVANCPALIEASEELMPSYDPLDINAWKAEVKRLISDDAYLAELRGKASLYKGAAYEEFGNAIVDAVLGRAPWSDPCFSSNQAISPPAAQLGPEEEAGA